MIRGTVLQRRSFLRLAGAGFVASSFAGPALAAPTASVQTRVLSLVNTHTGDKFVGAYLDKGVFVADAAAEINRIMRDHRTNEIHQIDPALLDLLSDLNGQLDTKAPYQIISGYRSPVTNAKLHEASDGVATRSLHMDGKAIDIRVQGVECAGLRDTALGMKRGGVGFYPDSDFVHVDTGRVRRW